MHTYYRHHVFFCMNVRDPDEPRPSCGRSGADKMWWYAKKRVRELDLEGKGKVRVNKAGCMDRCEEGPVLVIYPEGVWYTYKTEEDIEEIIREHLQGGRIVERLRLPA